MSVVECVTKHYHPIYNPRALAFSLKMDEFHHISCLNAPGGDEERGQIPRPREHCLPTPLKFFINQ